MKDFMKDTPFIPLLLTSYEQRIFTSIFIFIERRQLVVYCSDQPIRQRGKTTKFEAREHSYSLL